MWRRWKRPRPEAAVRLGEGEMLQQLPGLAYALARPDTTERALPRLRVTSWLPDAGRAEP